MIVPLVVTLVIVALVAAPFRFVRLGALTRRLGWARLPLGTLIYYETWRWFV